MTTLPAEETPSERGRNILLIVAAAAAPVLWALQLIAGLAVSNSLCFRGPTPAFAPQANATFAAMVAFDLVAIIGTIVAGIVAWRLLVTTDRDLGSGAHASRARFMAMWGIMSSVWFLGAIIFCAIAIAMVPVCLR